jgi:hypothetical protein
MLPITITALTLAAGVDADATKIIARASWTHARADVKSPGKDKVQLVIRSAAELDAAVTTAAGRANLAKELKVKEIDWAKQMLVVVSGGTQRKGGFRVEVTGLEMKGETLTVKWKITPPKGLATQAFTHPAEVVLIPAFAGKVVFDPAR